MAEPKYGSLDGLAVRWSDDGEAWQLSRNGVWHEINGADAATKAWVMTASEFHGKFGAVPLMPRAAFQSSE